MSCQNVAMIVTEIARGQMLDARMRADALTHMESCQLCAARFADEQTLNAGLRAVAPITGSTEVSDRIEAALLLAFRQKEITPLVSPRRALPPTRSRRTLHWAVAAAAAILIISALAIP